MVAMTANCVRAAMTARPMTMMITGQKRHTSCGALGGDGPRLDGERDDARGDERHAPEDEAGVDPHG